MAVSRTADALARVEPRAVPGRVARRRQARLRPAGFDDLGLRRALPDRMLPGLVGAMAFLAALAIAGAVGAAGLARHWQAGAGTSATIQVPRAAGKPASAKVLEIVRGTPGIAQARALTDEDLAELIRPWLGHDVERLSLPLPDVIEVRLSPDNPDAAAALAALQSRLDGVAPGTLVEAHAGWARRLATLARSLQAAAWAILVLVAGVAAAVIAIATRAGLLARRDAIEIVHDLGAPDHWIARRFSRRATMLAGGGALAGVCLAVPVLGALAMLIAPFATPMSGGSAGWADSVLALPPLLVGALTAIPPIAALIGWTTAAVTVRRWLGRLA